MFNGNLVKCFIKAVPKLTDDRFFQELVYGQFQFFSQCAGRIAKNLAWFIVYIRIVFTLGYFDRIQMTTDWLFPSKLSIIISLLDTAFDNALLVAKTVCAYFTIYSWCYPTKFTII